MTAAPEDAADPDARPGQAREQALAALLRDRARGRAAVAGRAAGRDDSDDRPRADRRSAPLSLSQRQLWYLTELTGPAGAYNELVLLTKTGSFDPAALRAALTGFVARHEAWRTTFADVDGEPRQVVHPAHDVPLPLVDLSDRPRAQARRRAAELAAQDARRPYDLTAQPPLRPHLFRIAADEHRLYTAMHHLIFDGVTLARVFVPEIQALYEAHRRGGPAPLPAPAGQYPDYAAWELRWAESAAFADRLDWWRRRLPARPPAALPYDHPRPDRPRHDGGMLMSTVGPGTAAALRERARTLNATLFQLLAATYACLLAEFAQTREPSFATAVDLRRDPAFDAMAGYCLAPIVLRVDLTGAPTFAEAVRRLQADFLDAYDRAVPFEPLVRALTGARDPRANPLFQTMFILQPAPEPGPSTDGWTLQLADEDASAVFTPSKFDLELTVDERPESHLQLRFGYDRDLFDAGTVDQIARRYAGLLERVAAAPDLALTELSRSDDAASAPADPDTAHRPAVTDLILQRAAATPSAVAVAAGDRALTYRELTARALAVAGRLTAAGAGRGTVVALLLDRSVDMVVGMLGVLLSGAAYLPLDGTQPADRLRFQVADAGARLVLTRAAARATSPVELPVVLVDDPAPSRTAEPPAVEPSDLAYVIYTSGSTGRPKGVLVEHGNLAYLAATVFPACRLAVGDVLVSLAPYTFDVATGDIFAGLVCGVRVVLASRDQVLDPGALGRLLAGSGATAMEATPTIWSELVSSGWAGDGRVLAIATGEPLPEPLASALLARCRGVVNAYGPTETTVWSACGPVRAGDPVTVGRALPGTGIYVLDEAGRRITSGALGEIVIAGPGVARGYANRPEETARRFGADPWQPGGRIYRTGDRGRLLADGRIRLLGRTDDQIKIRGNRIEPGEVETVLAGHPAVTAAAVALRASRSGEPVLAGYVVPRGDRLDRGELTVHLRARLPDYMVPAVLVPLERLPLTTSGKLDRAALPPPPDPSGSDGAGPTGSDGAGSDGAARAPRTPTEERVAAIWRRALDVAVDDVQADFFDLGGHSLLAARVVARTRQVFGQDLALADFLREGRTVAGLARLLDAHSRTGAPAGGPSRPVFFVFPDPTSAGSARHFIDVFGQDHPVELLIAAQQRGRFDRSLSLEDAAGALVAQVRRRQPVGPYALAGYSSGGLLAYAVAGQLAGSGAAVQWVALLDAPTPRSAQEALDWHYRLDRRWSRQLSRRPADQLAAAVEVPARAVRQVMARLGLREPTGADFDLRGALTMCVGYRTDGFAFPAELVVTAESVAMTTDPLLGWGQLHRGPLSVHSLPGDHSTLLRPPLVEEVAGLLHRSLAAAHPPAGRPAP